MKPLKRASAVNERQWHGQSWSPATSPVRFMGAGWLVALAIGASWVECTKRLDARILSSRPSCFIKWYPHDKKRPGSRQTALMPCDDLALGRERDRHKWEDPEVHRGRALDVIFDDRSGQRHQARLFLQNSWRFEQPHGDVVRIISDDRTVIGAPSLLILLPTALVSIFIVSAYAWWEWRRWIDWMA